MELLRHLKGLISNEAGVWGDILNIARLEAKLARLSILPLMINVGILIIVGLSFWLTLILTVGYAAWLLFHSILGGILSVLVLHIIMLGFLIHYLLFNLKNMSFENTRKIFSKDRAVDYEKLEKTDHSGH